MNAGTPSCLAVIPARGGSKGVPGKNIRPLAGTPLFEYSVKVSRECRFITRTMVTTDSPEIREAALRAGAEAPFLRPADLATDTARSEDAILHAMDWYEARDGPYDFLCLLEPTAPLRRAVTLEEGFRRLLADPGAEAVMSVIPYDYSPVFGSPLKPDGFMKDWMDERYKWKQRQEIPVFYHPAPAVFLSRWNAFRRTKTFLQDKTLAMVVDPVEATDIDTPLDFFMAERLVEHGIRSSEDLRRRITSGPGSTLRP